MDPRKTLRYHCDRDLQIDGGLKHLLVARPTDFPSHAFLIPTALLPLISNKSQNPTQKLINQKSTKPIPKAFQHSPKRFQCGKVKSAAALLVFGEHEAAFAIFGHPRSLAPGERTRQDHDLLLAARKVLRGNSKDRICAFRQVAILHQTRPPPNRSAPTSALGATLCSIRFLFCISQRSIEETYAHAQLPTTTILNRSIWLWQHPDSMHIHGQNTFVTIGRSDTFAATSRLFLPAKLNRERNGFRELECATKKNFRDCRTSQHCGATNTLEMRCPGMSRNRWSGIAHDCREVMRTEDAALLC